MKDFYKRFYRADYCEKLEKQRLKKGLTHREIATTLGTSRQTICAVFHGRNQNPQTVEAVANMLGIFFAQLIH